MIKITSSWNAILIKGLVDCYKAFGDDEFLKMALFNAHFIKEKLIIEGVLYHTYTKGIVGVPGFLEDYASVIQSFISIYQVTFEETWLQLAKTLTHYTIKNFFDPIEEMFFFSSRESETLIARKKEIFDNVIPSGNSIMAFNLLQLGHYFEVEEFKKIAWSMSAKTKKLVLHETAFMANWASLLIAFSKPVVEIAIVGKEALKFRKELQKHYFPNALIYGCETYSKLPFLIDKKPGATETMFFICYKKTCQKPTNSITTALDLIRQAYQS